ncbi:MAG: hypothetical protein ACP5KY_02090 [Thermoproteus sp.]|jgi:hypothetical protein
MRDDECAKRLKELEERIEALEGLVNLALEELRDIRSLLEQRGSAARARDEGGHPLLRAIEERKFLDTKEIRSKSALRGLIERGVVVLLRDEGANREIATTKKIVSDLLSRLPLDVGEAERLGEREYELLEILNRLGYVIKKDNKYVATQLADEFKT